MENPRSVTPNVEISIQACSNPLLAPLNSPLWSPPKHSSQKLDLSFSGMKVCSDPLFIRQKSLIYSPRFPKIPPAQFLRLSGRIVHFPAGKHYKNLAQKLRNSPERTFRPDCPFFGRKVHQNKTQRTWRNSFRPDRAFSGRKVEHFFGPVGYSGRKVEIPAGLCCVFFSSQVLNSNPAGLSMDPAGLSPFLTSSFF